MDPRQRSACESQGSWLGSRMVLPFTGHKIHLLFALGHSFILTPELCGWVWLTGDLISMVRIKCIFEKKKMIILTKIYNLLRSRNNSETHMSPSSRKWFLENSRSNFGILIMVILWMLLKRLVILYIDHRQATFTVFSNAADKFEVRIFGD